MKSLARYTPSFPSLFSHKDQIVTSFDRVFNDIFGEIFPESSKELGMDLFSKGAYPKVNVIDEEKETIIEAEISGLSKDQVKVEIDGAVLTIRGEKKVENKGGKDKTYLYRELKQSSFSRSFQFNENSDLENIKAKFENGLLTLTIPKKVPEPKEKNVKTITIE
jgi:HSP20 family protein